MPGKPDPPPPALADKTDVSLVAQNMISARMRFQQLSPSGFCANSVAPLLQCLSIEPFTLSVIWSSSPSLAASLKHHNSTSEDQLRTRQERNIERTSAIIWTYVLYVFLKFLLEPFLAKHALLWTWWWFALALLAWVESFSTLHVCLTSDELYNLCMLKYKHT